MTDLEIAQKNKMLRITEIAKKLGIEEEFLECYGSYKAKIDLNVKANNNKKGKVILVTAISPTPAGEGKSTTTIGLGDALNAIGKDAVICLREPSFGPVLGLKGGAAGGGYAQVVPMEDINLHFTGDIHAITTATNAVSAVLDNSIKQGNKLKIDPSKVCWHRALDMNDRALRDVVVCLGGTQNGVVREDHFDISVASEIMTILCLSNSLEDFKEKVGRCIVAYDYDNNPVTISDLHIAGALTVIMKDAIKPNLVQTLEHTPTLIHGGPFANIAHGCNSIIATNMARKFADYVVTEAGFGADLGAEKFLDIACRAGQFKPSAVVLVATIRALKFHGGVSKKELEKENLEALEKGISNLEAHIGNIKKYNLDYVVAVNKFSSDTDSEIKFLMSWASSHGHKVVLSTVFADGSKGGLELARVVSNIADSDKGEFKPLYDINMSLTDKIEKVAKDIYGASKVKYSAVVKRKLKEIEEREGTSLAVCMAKTQYSLSDNPKLLGIPKDFELTVKDVRISRGAGFVVVLCGDIITMPGLPKVPAAENIDYVDGKVVGLF